MAHFFSDEVSELYRKYILKVKLSSSKSYYLLWGTDETDKDYLLTDSQNQIIAFMRIKDLILYVKKFNNNLIDNQRLKKWSLLYKGKRAYTTFNFIELKAILNDKENAITHYGMDSLLAITNFCDLFSDYAYQINQKDFINLYENENLRILIDYFNAKFLWDSSDKYISALTKQIGKSALSQTKEVIRVMYQIFIENIIIMKVK